MKIAFLTHEPFYPPSGGGSAEAIYLVEEMVLRGHHVHLFSPRVDPAQLGSAPAALAEINLHGFDLWEMTRYTRLRSAKYLAYPFFLERLVRKAANKMGPFDLVFSQHAIAAVAAGRLKKRWNTPVVMNFLDYLTGFMETWPPYLAPRPALHLLERFEISLPGRYGADGILTVSDTLADHFARGGYPREKILPIYYGFDASLFPFREPKWPGAGEPLVVAMHGSFDYHHLGPIARETVIQVTRSLKNVVFRFIGKRTPALENFIRRVHAQNPQARLENTGFIPYERVADELAKAHLGIVPYEESTGTHSAFVAKIVENLAVGLPVVSTALNSATRYFAGEPMIRFSAFEGRGFADLVVQSLRAPSLELPARASAASQRVHRDLDWRSISAKALDFVEEVAGL